MIVGEHAVSRGESNEYRPEDQSQPSEDDLFSQPLDFDDLADESPVGDPSASAGQSDAGPTSDILSFESEPAAAGDRVEPEQAEGSGAFSFEPDESAEPDGSTLPASAESSGETDEQPLPDQWQPQSSDEAEWTAASSEEPADAVESAGAFSGEADALAAGPSDAVIGENEAPRSADEESETMVSAEEGAEEGAEAGIPGELPAGLLGIGAGEQAASEESVETAEQPDEEEKEKKPGLLHRLAEASPYTVMLGLSCLAILLACIFLMIELWRYEFDIGAKSGKKLSQAGVAAEWIAPADDISPRMFG